MTTLFDSINPYGKTEEERQESEDALAQATAELIADLKKNPTKPSQRRDRAGTGSWVGR